jgi:hypothetical protein
LFLTDLRKTQNGFNADKISYPGTKSYVLTQKNLANCPANDSMILRLSAWFAER